MRDYDEKLIDAIRAKQSYEMIDGVKTLVKRVPDDDREHVMDPRVLAIAAKKKERIANLKLGFSLANERHRPDKISYDLTQTKIRCVERLIQIQDHKIDAYIYTPEDAYEKMPLIVYFHGGGYTAGDMSLYVNQMKLICELSHAVVLFPEYRLAPENPYPAQIEDGYGTIEWAIENSAYLQIDPDKIMIAGDSAGGSLVNSCLILDEKKLIHEAFEIYPGVDSSSQDQFDLYTWSYDDYPIVEEQKELAYSRIEKIEKHSHGDENDNLFIQGKTTHDNPLISIIYASDDQLRALPKIVIAYSEYDFLRISNQYFAKRLALLNHDVEVIEYCGCDHGFLDCLGLVPQAEELCMTIAEAARSMGCS